MRRALFLDRDGVINKDVGYLHRTEDFEFIDGAIETCREFQEAGYLLIVITNQAGIARGYYTEEDFQTLNSWMLEQFKQSGVQLDGVYYSPFHPEHGLGRYKQDSFCRKPNPGLILQAQREHHIDLPASILVGDKESDIEAGLAANVGTCVLVRSGRPIDQQATKAHLVADSLASLPELSGGLYKQADAPGSASSDRSAQLPLMSKPDGAQFVDTYCPICKAPAAYELTKDGCAYSQCSACDFLFYRASELGQVRDYDKDYWDGERQEALRREREDCFLRAIELIYLSAIPVENILDFGSGVGVTVGMLRDGLGLNAVGVDPFGEFGESPFLHRMTLKELHGKYPQGYFDAIYSIEVFEHLEDPRQTMSELCYFLKPGGKLLVNTGTREFLAKYDPEANYIDPLVRGHISIYALKSFDALGREVGLKARFLGDRTYMVLLESPGAPESYPRQENLGKLARLGSWAPMLFNEYMRLIPLEKELLERSQWALALSREVDKLKAEKGSRGN